MFILLFILFNCTNSIFAATNLDEKRLYNNLIAGYNRLIRPVGNNTDKLTVHFGVKLTQLLDVDEKNQILTTNMWLRQEWVDINLVWDPLKFGNITSLIVPSASIWVPDLILFNSADGRYDAMLMTKAVVHSNGSVVWEPPAIYKSSCTINVEFFPFDQQHCIMKFGSWTYDGLQVDLVHFDQPKDENGSLISEEIPIGIDLRDFYRSIEWDVMGVSARRNNKVPSCASDAAYPDITFNITLRRKTLFYTVNLIIPCVCISFLTVLTFYLPSDSGEKICLCVSILQSLTVLFLLLNELIPPTSLVVPLIGKYLLFTMILVTLSITVTVVVLNVHFRSTATHSMPPWVKRVFLHVLPKLLLMRRPQPPAISTFLNSYAKASKVLFERSLKMRESLEFPISETTASDSNNNNRETSALLKTMEFEERKRETRTGILDAIKCLRELSEHLKQEDEEKKVKEEWKYVALVIDRLFLWIFTTACAVGTCGIILQAPSFYDKQLPIDAQISKRFSRDI